MKKVFVLVMLGAAGIAMAQTAAPSTKPSRAAKQDPTVAAVKVGDNGDPNPAFMKRHEQYVARAKQGDVGVLFLGDSITQGWEHAKKVWDSAFGEMKPANFGIGGDRTQHVLWRIENGELEGIKPKVAVIMIGTNNLSSDPWEKIAEGIEKIVHETHEKTGAKVLLLGIFPRGANPADPGVKGVREKIAQINERISKLDDGGKTIKYMDIKARFLEPDATIAKTIMPDFLHLSEEGYQRWADAVKPEIEEMMKG
ncbi:MAG TPA: GDSL-type esterase/lipase family protein [Tepidisphaeraceae bacterium]|jgi:lysophospholipase L1-like esterase